jgi:hypothetical protein
MYRFQYLGRDADDPLWVGITRIAAFVGAVVATALFHISAAILNRLRSRNMTSLIEIARERQAPHSMYLRYAKGQAVRTESLDAPDHYVNVDLAAGKVIGIEIPFPDDRSVDLVAQYAHEQGLSLVGVFGTRPA